MKDEIWRADDERAELWETAPERAARLAYLEVVLLWADQVEKGQYRGIPCPHRLSKRSDDGGRQESVDRSPDSRFTRDSAAGVYHIPAEVIVRWKQAA